VFRGSKECDVRGCVIGVGAWSDGMEGGRW